MVAVQPPSDLGIRRLVIEEVTGPYWRLQMQGPTSYSALARCGLIGVDAQAGRDRARSRVDGITIKVSPYRVSRHDLGYESLDGFGSRGSDQGGGRTFLIAAGYTRGIRLSGRKR